MKTIEKQGSLPVAIVKIKCNLVTTLWEDGLEERNSLGLEGSDSNISGIIVQTKIRKWMETGPCKATL